MSYPFYHYADADNQPVGPLAAEQLHALVRAGTIPPDTAVWKEGATEWHPYHSMFPPPVVRRPAGAPFTAGVAPSQSLRPWYKRTGWSIVLFYFCAPVMLPLMWYWKLYTLRTRIVVTTCFAGLFLWAFVSVIRDENALRREFAANKAQIISRVKDADATGDYEQVVHLGERYAIIHDAQLDGYLDTARAALKAAKGQATAIEESLRRPDPAKGEVYQSAWRAGYEFGKQKRGAGEQPIGQEVYAAALETGEWKYPLSPMDQMTFAEGFTGGFEAGYVTDAERKARAEQIAAQRRAEADQKRKANQAIREESAAAEKKAMQEATAEEKAVQQASVPVTDWSGMTKAQWVQKASVAFRWSRRQPLITPAAHFQQVMGKPNRTQAVGGYLFWYYECADGTVQLEADASVLQAGTLQAQVSD